MQTQADRLKLTLLGTGTSQGVPVIGCECPVCTSTDPRDQRLRSAALLTYGHTNILIDAGPDLRQQMLRARVRHLDAILLTHEHNDHVIGLDDVRPFNFSSGKPMAVYAQARVAEVVRFRFAYVFESPGPGLPRIELHPIDVNTPLYINGLHIQPIGIWHGNLPILGFRFGEFTYLTDVKRIEAEELTKIKGTRFLIINALRRRAHPTHLTLEEALALIEEIKPEHAWLTHVSHELGLARDVSAHLPPGVSLGYDGLEISCP
ncbi:MAG: MBL fold metallo-hydrolase [Saprospiraceae bacterium]|nr:MBL fold metallo-hydrolase [Saprospiraceae bacterium]MDW8482837.1 MBL fold metallo-hydrolase [Saprospiraceae bacterium]